MKNNYRFRPILFTLMFLILIPILIIQAYIYNKNFYFLYDRELHSNLEVARVAGKMFEDFVSGVLSLETALGNTLTYFPSLTGADRNILLSKSLAEIQHVKNFTWVSPNGIVLATTVPGEIGSDVSKRSDINKIISGSPWVIGDLYQNSVTNELEFSICKGIRNDSGALQGIIVTTIDEAHLDREFSLHRPNGGAISIMDSKGILVYRHPIIEANLEQRNWLKTFPEIQRTLDGYEYMGTTFAPYEGKNRIFATVPLSFGWAAGAGRTEKEITAPIYEVLFERAVLFLVVLAFALLMASFLSWRVSKSVRKLENYSETVARGDYAFDDYKFIILEFQELADALQKMADQIRLREEELRIANDKLEQKVMERTSELKIANHNLKSANYELECHTAKLRALAGELTMVEQRVRREVAKILHDHLQQILASARFQVQGLSGLNPIELQQLSDQLYNLLGEAIQVSRSLSTQLSPPILFESGMGAGLSWLARWMDEKHKFKVQLEVDKNLPEVADDVKTFLFESARELLFNARKHSGVDTATVTLRQIDGQKINMIVADNGKGFNLNNLTISAERYKGFGLFSIMERISLFGGDIKIESSPGHGSKFSLRIPFAYRQEQSCGLPIHQSV